MYVQIILDFSEDNFSAGTKFINYCNVLPQLHMENTYASKKLFHI